VSSISSCDELGSYADTGACSPHAALDNILDTQGPGNISDIFLLTFKGERGGPRDHLQPRHVHQLVYELFCQAIREIFTSASPLAFAKGSTAIEALCGGCSRVAPSISFEVAVAKGAIPS
jgi:hypothetical protein